MSSATSIERELPATADRARRQDSSGKRGAESRETFRPWHFFVLASLIAATAAVMMSRQSSPEALVLISLTVGAAGFAAAALYRALVPLVSDAATGVSEPLSEGMRAILEREKALALRAIKDLEFDRAMGKVSPSDFEEMAGRLRARAMALMKQLDEGGYRELIERELSARLRTPAVGAARSAMKVAPAAEKPSAATSSPVRSPAQPGATAAASKRCSCGTVNDPDSRFCKQCGAKLEWSAP